MANYNREYGKQYEQKMRRSMGGRMLDGFVFLLTIIVGAVLLMTYIAPYANPAGFWLFSILGLAAPVTYMAALLLLLYWIIRWRWGPGVVMLLLVCIGLFKVSLFYNPTFKRTYETIRPSSRGVVTFMTYNVRQFYDDRGQSSADDVFKMIREQDPDIVCMQEFNALLAEESDSYAEFCEGYEHSAGGRSDELQTAQMALFSKYRILRWGPLATDVRRGEMCNSIWADLALADDTVRVFSNHLHSTAINAADNDFITKHQYISDTAREVKIRSIVRRFRDNSIVRAAEVDSIAVYLAQTPYARIVCGDFNDTPMSYVYRTMSEELNDAFRICGKGYSYTYRGFFNTLRIDYVFSSDEFEPLTYDVLTDVKLSDHLPVVVRMRHTPRN